ncbi:hypothetical protein KIW84_045405 [Lathyrus oleraceus]|uniref:Uncharacterized protein n=1 Tax=Pisum sativum TaxID=3888 RepID=A0A9D5AWP2_PEA|nr:hypothetical protein KIW84_045405 [Pisum sativum]
MDPSASFNNEDGPLLEDISQYRWITDRLLYQTVFRPDISFAINKLNADRGSCITTRKSTTGFWIFIDESLVVWRSKKQATMLRSSGQAEYRVLASATSKLLWLKQLLRAFNIDVP